MHGVVQRQHAGLVVEAGIDLRKLAHREHDRADQERERRQMPALRAPLRVEPHAQGLELADVDLLDIGVVRNAALGLLHLLRDLAAQADDLHRRASPPRRATRRAGLAGTGDAARAVPPARWASRSACVMRPAVPLGHRRPPDRCRARTRAHAPRARRAAGRVAPAPRGATRGAAAGAGRRRGAGAGAAGCGGSEAGRVAAGAAAGASPRHPAARCGSARRRRPSTARPRRPAPARARPPATESRPSPCRSSRRRATRLRPRCRRA